MAEAVLPELTLEWAAVPTGMFTTMEFTDDPYLPSLTHPVTAVTLAEIDAMDPGNGGVWDENYWFGAPPCTSGVGGITDYYVVAGPVAISGPFNMCNVAIIADYINLGQGNLDNVLLVTRASGPPEASNPERYEESDINFSGSTTMINVTIAARGTVNVGPLAQLGGAQCNTDDTGVEIFAMGDIIFQSDVTIANATIAAADSVTVQSGGSINLSGANSTIQALNNVTIQTDGVLGACPPEEGEGGEDPPEGEGQVVGENNRLVN